MNELIETFVKDIQKECFRSLYDDVSYVNTLNEHQGNQEVMYILIINNFAYPFEEIRYSDDFSMLSEHLLARVGRLDVKYESRDEYENILSKDNELVAFRGSWNDGIISYFHEGVIIKANKLLDKKA